MGGEEGGGGGFEAFSVLIMLRKSMVAVVEGGHWSRRKSDYIQTEKMKLSKSRDPGPPPDFAASFLQPHFFLQLHFFFFFFALASCFSCSSLLYLYIFSLFLHPCQVSKLVLFSSHYQQLSVPRMASHC